MKTRTDQGCFIVDFILWNFVSEVSSDFSSVKIAWSIFDLKLPTKMSNLLYDLQIISSNIST